MSSRAFKLFRVLIPSWGFFAEVADLPVLFVRTADAAGSWSEWSPALIPPSRNILSIVFNPKGNLHLACNTLLQQVESDIGELSGNEVDEFDQSVSFTLLHNLVRCQLCGLGEESLSRGRFKDIAQYQFRLERRPQGDVLASSSEIFLTSKVYTV